MLKIQTIGSALLVTLALAACNGTEQEAATPPKVEDTAFGDMVGTMDKARGVEDTVAQQKEAIDQALRQNEQPSAE